MKTFIIFTALIILFHIKAHTQEAIFHHYTNAEGLSQSVVNYIFQDSEGFIWVGTQAGLNKFNGYNFEKFTQNLRDTNSLKNHWIYCITEDKKKNIWIGTKDGLHKYIGKSNKMVRVLHPSYNSDDKYSNYVYGIAIDKFGNIITNTPPVLNFINPETLKFTSYTNTIGTTTAVDDQCFPVFVDKEGLIWIATSGGLASFNYETKKFTNYTYNPKNENSISDNTITAIFEDSNGKLWIGTRNGLNSFDKTTGLFKSYYNNPLNPVSLSRNFIRTIVEDRRKNIWIGTDGGGISRMSLHAEGVFYHFKSSANPSPSFISNDFVYSLLIDKSYNLWIGTLSGLDKLNLKPKKFRLIRKSESPSSVELLDNIIASVFKNNDGKIWIGNWGKGLNIYDRKTGKVEHYASTLTGKQRIINDHVHVIYKDNEKRIWIGTRDGIQIFDDNTKSFISIQDFFNTKKLPDFRGNRIYGIIQDHLKNFWIATRSGLYVLNIDAKEYKTYQAGNYGPNQIADNLIYNILKDRDNEIWIATNNGLSRYNFNTNSFIHYKKDDKNIDKSLCDNFVVSLCEDYQGNIWIGTNNGVNVFNKKNNEFSIYTENDGLPASLIYAIEEDNNKNLWFATVKGLCTFDRQTKSFKKYEIEDGLQSLEFNLHASHKAYDGELFFGGMNGLNSFYPDSLIANKFIPPIVFTSLEYEKTKQIINLEGVEEITIEFHNFPITIEFAALEFTNSQKNQYAYKIDGVIDNWTSIGNRRFHPFATLPDGEYIFRVKGSNNDGIWNEDGNSLKIIIRPPWWRSKLAIVCYILSTIILFFTIIKLRERNLKKQKLTLERKVAERTEEVEKQKNEILAKNSELNLQKEEIQSQRDELERQRDVVIIQRDQILDQNKQITDSILYAKRIQTAVLPSDIYVNQVFRDSFIFFKPKHIVSGDFYWVKKIHDISIIVVADCTGHGVPGAFMSMLGISALNEIISFLIDSKTIVSTTAAEILDELRRKIIAALQQSGRNSETRDGIDMVLCLINNTTNQIQFSGANNSLIIIRDNNLIELKGDNMPIGIHKENNANFTNKTFDLQKGDCLYMFSDGFKDQFGGPSGRKFLYQNFKKLLLSIHTLPTLEQHLNLNETFTSWTGNRDQVDDILVMGIRI